MKKYILILVSILYILSSVGCGEGKETVDIQGILVDGVFYEKSYQPMPAEVDESAIIGYVESYTDTIPKKDGESNISKDLIGAPYAKVEGGIAILYENEWYLCKAETSEGVSIAPDVSDETISFHDKTFNKSDLSQDTIEWLVKYNSLSEEEQLAISGIPADLYELCGYPTTEDMEPCEPLNSYANNLLSRLDTDKNKNDSTLDSDEFWENVIELIFYDFDENVETGYEAEYLTHGMPVEFDTSNVKNEWFKIGVAVQNDSDKGPIAVSVEVEGVEVRIQNKANQDFFNAVVLEVNGNEILTECAECESGWIFEGCEVAFDTNTLSTEEVPDLEVGDLIRVVYVGGTNEKESVHLDQVVSIFWIDDNGKIVTAPAKKSVQKIETPDFGITLTVKNVTSKGLTLVCEQSGGESIGELFSGSSYSLSRYVEGNWETIEYLPKATEVAWTDEAWIIPLEDTVEWEVNWEWLYGELVPGKYRMSKPVMNLFEPGDFNTAVHFVEFDVAE